MLNEIMEWREAQKISDEDFDHLFQLAKQLLDALVNTGQTDCDRLVILSPVQGSGYQTTSDFRIPRGANLTQKTRSMYPSFTKGQSSIGKDYGLSMDPYMVILLLMSGLIWSAGITIRTFIEPWDPIPNKRKSTVTGYHVANRAVYLLSEALVFNAYCTDSETGGILAPESDTKYIASPVLLGFPTVAAEKEIIEH